MDNADKIKAKIILEMANAPVSLEADRVLSQIGVRVIPDIIANAGGVIVSYFEWDQNMKGEHWAKEKVFKKLEDKITESFEKILSACQLEKCNFRKSAYVVAIKRILNAERKRGNLWGRGI
jgi:glutamate dehydrogenase/leucine dehydrogenase